MYTNMGIPRYVSIFGFISNTRSCSVLMQISISTTFSSSISSIISFIYWFSIYSDTVIVRASVSGQVSVFVSTLHTQWGLSHFHCQFIFVLSLLSKLLFRFQYQFQYFNIFSTCPICILVLVQISLSSFCCQNLNRIRGLVMIQTMLLSYAPCTAN